MTGNIENRASKYSGISWLLFALAVVAMAFSFAAPKEIRMVPDAPSGTPYSVAR